MADIFNAQLGNTIKYDRLQTLLELDVFKFSRKQTLNYMPSESGETSLRPDSGHIYPR
jgi:hypothetical protein